MAQPHGRPDIPDLTGELAAFACRSRFEDLPEVVQRESARAFLNWMGCAFGGCHEPAVEIAVAMAEEVGGAPQASIIGRARKTDIVNAAFVNCLSSSVLAFDDTHLATVTHPTGPIAAALFAWCQRETVPGAEFLSALALGMEIQCRLSNVLLLPPAEGNLALYITGITGPVGAAAALGRLLGLDERRMRWALGLAATQASGFRATHATMAGAFPPAHAARSGVLAALMAAKGFTCSDRVLEAEKGFVDVFSSGADLGHAVADLGRRFELLANAYKPYPCGIVVQPAIDACLAVAERMVPGAQPALVKLRVHPLALTLADRPQPRTVWEAQISLQHWAAVAILRRSASLAEARQDCIDDPAVAALRARVEAVADPSIARDAASAEVTLTDGTPLRAHVANARGSVARPMTDDELDDKFRVQTRTVLSDERTERLLQLCRGAADLRDLGAEIAATWSDR